MSKRAKEAALKAYPPHKGASENWIKAHLSSCVEFIQGYEQAEKDLALTWRDIAFICQTYTEVINSLPNKPCPYTPGFKDVYGEVLKCFNEQRNK